MVVAGMDENQVAVRRYFDKTTLGWSYICEVGPRTADGWRPFRAWAMRAAQRRSQRILRELADERTKPKGTGRRKRRA